MGRIEERPHGRPTHGRPLPLALGRARHQKASELESCGSYGRASRLARFHSFSHVQFHVRD